MFVMRPVTWPKLCRFKARASRSCFIRATKIAASSAYREVLTCAAQLLNVVSTSRSVARSKSYWRGSMAKTKRSGERGSPCRKPVPCLIGTPGIPLIKTREDEVDRRAVIQSRHRAGKPLFWTRSSRESHLTESKALAISTFIKSVGVFVR